MNYTTLGKTGLRVSRLGFGAMRLPMEGEGEQARVNRELSTPLLRRAVELGVTYFDTAVFYCNADSQRALGDALKGGLREKVVVSTKNDCHDTDEKKWWTKLEDSLERLQTSWIDVYNHHGVNAKGFRETTFPTQAKWMEKARDQNLIRHICLSFHDNADGLREIIRSGYPEVITIQYNLLDRQLEDAIAEAHERGIGVVVMGPVAGGRLGAASETLESLVPGIRRVPELAMRFVLANPNVNVALSGMQNLAQLEENVAACGDATALSDADRALIDEQFARLKKMAALYCTGCNYCMPCPKDVQVPKIFEAFNRGRVYGLWESAKNAYNDIGSHDWNKGARADACVECGACEKKCPQKIPVMAQLREARKALEKT
ncbi:MAG: aldo/keto reductase [Kiritimatiellaeota bacterium]|nr:aldo/keto reductase [Kiritimatiellota bacterium]